MTINYENIDPQNWLKIIETRSEKKNSLKKPSLAYRNFSSDTLKKMDIKKICEISQSIIAALPKNEIKSEETATKINKALSRILEQKSDKLKETISLTNSTWINALKWVAVATIIFIPTAAVIQLAQILVTNIAQDELKTIEKLKEPLWIQETTHSVTNSFKPLESFQKVQKENNFNEAKIENSGSSEEEEVWDDISLRDEELKFKDDNKKEDFIDERDIPRSTKAEETFRELLKGERVDLKSAVLQPQSSNDMLNNFQIYVPEIVAKDLPRFDLLRFNGETIYSNFQQGVNRDPVVAYRNLLEEFGEEPDFQPLEQEGEKNPLPSTKAPVTNAVLTALSQANLADFIKATIFFDEEGNFHNQTFAEVSREIYLEGGLLTIYIKALVYERVTAVDTDETHAVAAHIISRKLVMNLDQLKESLKNKAPGILIDFKGEDKISENLLLREKGETIQDTPQIINSHDRSFRIKKELAYELLKKISYKTLF